MYSPTFRLKAFESISDAAKFRIMNSLLEALVETNVEYLQRHPRTPLLYASGVRYQPEPDGRDEWQDIPDTLARGDGDCEDLACWRAAEYRLLYGYPEVEIGLTKTDMPLQSGAALVTMYHIVNVLPHGLVPGAPAVWAYAPDGRIVEDPSRTLGMP